MMTSKQVIEKDMVNYYTEVYVESGLVFMQVKAVMGAFCVEVKTHFGQGNGIGPGHAIDYAQFQYMDSRLCGQAFDLLDAKVAEAMDTLLDFNLMKEQVSA